MQIKKCDISKIKSFYVTKNQSIDVEKHGKRTYMKSIKIMSRKIRKLGDIFHDNFVYVLSVYIML